MIFFISVNGNYIGIWGLGIGDLGIGDWGLANPQAPIPNPHKKLEDH